MSKEDWAEFEHGVNLFNEKKFWHAHEAWENVWKRHEEDERLFFQGLIQLAAAYHHLVTQRSFRGMMNNFDKAYTKLVVFRPQYLGVQIEPLLHSIEQGKREVQRVGWENIELFDPALFPTLQFQRPQ